MALDRWNVQAIAAEEAYKALTQLNLAGLIAATVEAEMDAKIKRHVDEQLSALREAVKIINQQQEILKRAIERVNENNVE